MDWLPAFTGLIGVAGPVITLWVKATIDRKSRADAIALKLLDARISEYPAIQTALAEVVYAVSVYLSAVEGDTVAVDDPSGNAFTKIMVMKDLQARFSHLISPELADALFEFDRANFHFLATDARTIDVKKARAELQQLILSVRERMRIDCGGDRATDHLRSVIDPEPTLLSRQWRKTQAALVSQKVAASPPAALPSETKTGS